MDNTEWTILAIILNCDIIKQSYVIFNARNTGKMQRIVSMNSSSVLFCSVLFAIIVF